MSFNTLNTNADNEPVTIPLGELAKGTGLVDGVVKTAEGLGSTALQGPESKFNS